jgi:hypothetical protein
MQLFFTVYNLILMVVLLFNVLDIIEWLSLAVVHKNFLGHSSRLKFIFLRSTFFAKASKDEKFVVFHGTLGFTVFYIDYKLHSFDFILLLCCMAYL